MSDEPSELPFAGEVFLTLAAEGRLHIDSATADGIIAELEETLALVRNDLRVLEICQSVPRRLVADLPEGIADAVIETMFRDQVSPGRLAEAARELPKYIEALRLARSAK